MQLLTPADAAGRVTAALKSAAETTGAGFDYLYRTATRESSMNPTAQSPSSSARGLFQFIDSTWLQVLKEEGPKLGLGDAAADVSKTSSGRYTVRDPARRAELLAMRDDPQAAALIAGAFTKRNAETLTGKLGRAPTEGELYAAHFLGANGASELVSLAASAPQTPAAGAFPSQAAANRAVFFDKGRPRTALELYDKLTSGPKGVEVADASTASPRVAAAPARVVAEEPRYNNGVENDGAAFHSMFKTGRRAPVSAYVAQAWSAFGDAGSMVADVSSSRVRSTAAMAQAYAPQPAAVAIAPAGSRAEAAVAAVNAAAVSRPRRAAAAANAKAAAKPSAPQARRDAAALAVAERFAAAQAKSGPAAGAQSVAETRPAAEPKSAAQAKPVRQPIDLIAFLRNVFVTPQSGSEGRQ